MKNSYKLDSLLGHWLVFIKVVESRSFSAAAVELHRSVSTISKSIAKLESILQIQLLHRNAHAFELTPAGQVTYEKAKFLWLSYNELLSELKAPEKTIQGVLRLSAPAILCEKLIPGWIINYTQDNPDATINLQAREGGSFASNSPEFDDLVIKSGYIDSPDLVHKKIAPVPFGLYASPAYISSHSVIIHPDDLSRHDVLKLEHPSLSGEISLKKGDESKSEPLGIDIPVFSTNNIASLITMTIEGHGVAVALPAWSVKTELENGELIQVLPGWQLPSLPSYLVWRYRRQYSLLFRDFITFIENEWNVFFNKSAHAEISPDRKN